MSVGKVVTGFLGKQDKDVLLHILDEQSAVCYLDERPPGDSIMRVWATKGLKKTSLVLSYKYSTFVFHHEYPTVTFRVSTEKNGAVRCKANPKSFKFIKRLATTFMLDLRRVISEFVSNKNFVEKEVASEEEIENNLLGRKFIIYPKDEAVIVRKKGKEKETCTITFDFQTFDFIANYGNNTSVFRSFNELLITFLGIDTRDRILVKATLGYQKDVDLFTGKQRNEGETSLDSMESEIEQAHLKPIFKAKEKDKLMEELRLVLGGPELEPRSATWPRKVPPANVRLNLRRLLESVRAIHQNNEKMDWVQRGVFQYLIKIMQRNGNETLFNEIPIKIAKHLCTYNVEACRTYCNLSFECVKADWECVGIYASFATLVVLPEFLKFFVGALGFPMLVDIYVKASIMLLGEHQTATMGSMSSDHTGGMSPRSGDIFSSEVSEDSDTEEAEEPSMVSFTSATSASGASSSDGESAPAAPSGKGVVPKLALPSLNLAKTKKPKSRRGSSRGKITTEQFEQSAQAQLNALGRNLGETYMAQDLTGLMAYLQEDDEVQSRKKMRVSVALTKGFSSLHNHDKGDPTIGVMGNNSLYYKIKCFILKILANITSHPQFFMYIPNPVNLLFSELLVSYKDGMKMYDEEFRSLIYRVLANFANYVEYFHQHKWKEISAGYQPIRALRMRKKMDRFVWRVHNRLEPAVDSRDVSEIVTQIKLLVDYMRHCPTRVMAAQVMDVCMLTLLRTKEMMMIRGKFTVESTEYAGLIHAVLEIFDELVAQNRSDVLDDALLALLVEDQDFWLFVRDFAGKILLKSKVERLVSTKQGKKGSREEIQQYRIRVIRHYRVLWKLLSRKRKALMRLKEGEERSEQLHNLDILIPEMEFLLDPANGYIMQMLSQVRGPTDQPSVQHEAMQLLVAVFSTPGCMFVKRKKYIDSYISFSYLSFIKLYHSLLDSDDTMTLIHDYLELLLSFSKQKTEKIIMKFYQLRCMDFFAREISLEYEITLETKPPRPRSKIKHNKTALKQDASESTSSGLDSNAGIKSLLGSVKPGGGTGKPIPSLSVPKKDDGKKSETRAKKTISFGTPAKPGPPKLGLNLGGVERKGTPVKKPPTPTSDDSSYEVESSSYGESSDESGSSSSSSEDDDSGSDSGSSDEGSSSGEESGSEEEQDAPTPAAVDDTAKAIPSLSEGSSAAKSNDKAEDGTSDESGEKESSEEESSSEEGSSSSEEETSSDDDGSSSSGDEPQTPPAKPKGLPALGLPKSVLKDGGEKKAGGKLGGMSLSLPSSAIKGGADKKSLSLSLPKSAIKGGTGDSEQSVPDVEEGTPKKLSMPKLKIPAERSAGKSKSGGVENSQPVGALSELEQMMDKDDPKMQLVLNKQAGKANVEVKKDLMVMTEEYSNLRKSHKLYQCSDVHITLLKLIFSLMMTQIGSLEPLYCDQFPLNNKKLNIPYLLKLHLNHPLNRDIIPRLAEEMHELGPNEYLLLKLICTRLFQKDMYKNLTRLATGAYGAVYRCRLEPSDAQQMDVAIKLMEVPKNIHARCVVHDIFTEVLILDRFKHDPRMCHTYEFGVDDEYYWIIMKRYKCSLKEWRKKQTAPLEQNLALYLNVYMNVLNTFRFLEENGVNHFDVKCDNFLIQPLNEDHWTLEDEQEFWHPTTDIPNFSLTLADFGESKIYKDELDGYTTRNRGTEFTKSPEMLAVAYASQKTRSTYDRRKKVGASSPSDIWSLGCLLYELLTGEFLFYDQDWVRFFIRVTVPGQELIPPEKQAKLLHNPALLEFLDVIFTRDPAYRPNIMDVIKKFKHVRTLVTSGQAKADPSKLSRRMMRMRDEKKQNSGDLAGSQPNSEPTTPKSPKSNSDMSSLSVGSVGSEASKKKAALLHSISQRRLIFDDPTMRDTEEMMYFWRTCSKILDYLYIGSEEAAKNKRMLKENLDITHVVNASSSAPMYPYDFGVLDVPQKDEDDSAIVLWIDRVVSFVNEVVEKHGKVLIYDNDGLSRCVTLAVGFLMVKNDWSFYESFIFVKNCRYMIEPNYLHATQLCHMRREKLDQITRLQFQCLCGSCTFNFVRECDTKLIDRCCCKIGEASTCPNHGCSEFLEKMLKYYQYPASSITWQRTTCSNVIGQFRKTTSEYIVGKELGIGREVTSKLSDKKWKLFKCQTCDFLTHAISTNQDSSDREMAVNTNVPVGQSSF